MRAGLRSKLMRILARHPQYQFVVYARSVSHTLEQLTYKSDSSEGQREGSWPKCDGKKHQLVSLPTDGQDSYPSLHIQTLRLLQYDQCALCETGVRRASES